MAEEQDSSNSRLLFTDLDVSDKGRPSPGASSPTAAVPFSTPLTSIAELASTLELDFEDDDGGMQASGAHPAPAAPAALPVDAAPRASVVPAAASDDDDPELDLLADTPVIQTIAPPPVAAPSPERFAAPTWSDYTQAFRNSFDPAVNEPIPFEDRRWRGRRQPYLFEDEADGDWDDPLLEEDVDILSAIEADDLERFDAIDDDEADDGDDAVDIDDANARRRNSSVTQVINPRQRLEAHELALREENSVASAAPVRPEAHDADERPALGDTIHEMFFDLDVNSLWEERMEKKGRAKGSADPHPATESRVLDMFDGVDLDALWKTSRQGGGKEGGARSSEPSGGETLILPPNSLDSLDNRETVIVPVDEIARAFSSPSSSSRRGKPPKNIDESAKKPDVAAPPAPDDTEFMVDLDDFLDADDSLSASIPALNIVQSPEVTEEEAFDDLQALLDDESGRVADENAAEASAPDGDVDGAASPEPGSDGSTLEDITASDVINGAYFDGVEAVNDTVSAPVIDDSAISKFRGPKPGTEEMQAIMGEFEPGEGGEDNGVASGAAAPDADAEPEPVAVNPMDVFANMDDMDFDFSDDMDDEMRAMLDDDDDVLAEDGDAAEEGGQAAAAPVEDTPPSGRLALGVWRAKKLARRFLPAKVLNIVDRLQAAIAWRDNWWFYCDLLAAIIASASLAVIISYYVWYRN